MTMFSPNDTWFTSAPPCSAQVPCADTMHTLRWRAGVIELPSHPDGEAELVLAALGGDKAGCVELAEAWQRHIADMSLLAIGPRGPADRITATWDSDAGAAGPGRPAFRAHPAAGVPRRMKDEARQGRLRMTDLLTLLALGPDFGHRLTGHVVAAHADRITGATRPALTAALEGRLAPVAERWLGIEPGQVRATPLAGSGGWGSAQLTGAGEQRELHVALPVTWLSSVWACGLALAGRHLVVAVTQPGWPDARVLALAAPGREPVELAVHGHLGDGDAGDGDSAHWEV
jgi:hypothetical protein